MREQKKTADAEVQLTEDPEDKNPFRRKQQKAISDESFKEKDVGNKLRQADRSNHLSFKAFA